MKNANTNAPSQEGLPAAGLNDAQGTAQPPRVLWGHIILACVGLLLSGYAVHLHNLVAAGAATGCGISETISCDKVIGSKPWGAPFGIPLGMFGLAYFGVVGVTAVHERNMSAAAYRKAALLRLGVGAVGVLFSLGLEVVMWAILRHGCPVCIATHVVTLVNFVLALVLWRRLARSQVGAVPTG